MKKLLVLSILLLSVTSLFADTKYPELEKLEQKYRPTVANEPSRSEYLIKLADLYFKYAHARNPDSDGWMAVREEILKYPLPSSVDTAKLRKLAAGSWSSPRHDYLYRANGTWSMLPLDDNSTSGTWKIDKNHFVLKAGDEDQNDGYTIYLLDGENFYYGDKTTVFFLSRITKKNPEFRWGYEP